MKHIQTLNNFKFNSIHTKECNLLHGQVENTYMYPVMKKDNHFNTSYINNMWRSKTE